MLRNKSKILYLFLFIFLRNSFPQNESYQFELFSASIENSKLSVKAAEEKIILEKEFSHPSGSTSDLDEDGLQEFFVIDTIQTEGDTNFTLYIYNTIDSFYLSDSINSGLVYPYETYSGEIDGLIIVSGNPDFSYLNESSKTKMLPINCWKFEDGEVFSVNEDLYEIFISENESVISEFDSLSEGEINNCIMSKNMKSLTASVYINYLNADEKTSAKNFLKEYYLCDDLEAFKNELNNLFYKENQ